MSWLHTRSYLVIDGVAVAVPVIVAALEVEIVGVPEDVAVIVEVNDTLAVNDGVNDKVGVTDPENVVPTDTVAVVLPVIVGPDDSDVDGVTEIVGVFDGVTEIVGVFDGVPDGVFDAPIEGVAVAVPVMVM